MIRPTARNVFRTAHSRTARGLLRHRPAPGTVPPRRFQIDDRQWRRGHDGAERLSARSASRSLARRRCAPPASTYAPAPRPLPGWLAVASIVTRRPRSPGGALAGRGVSGWAPRWAAASSIEVRVRRLGLKSSPSALCFAASVHCRFAPCRRRSRQSQTASGRSAQVVRWSAWGGVTGRGQEAKARRLRELRAYPALSRTSGSAQGRRRPLRPSW